MAEVEDIIPKTVHVQRALSESDMHHVHAIRQAVFVVEQRVDPSEEYDVYETTSRHYLAFLAADPVGTARCRITETGKLKLERIAVRPHARGKGVGAALVQQMLADAPPGISIYMHAQTHALPFYEKLGFRAEGDRFDEAGIEHVVMVYTSPR